MNRLAVGNVITDEKGRPYICIKTWFREGNKHGPEVIPVNTSNVTIGIPKEDRVEEGYEEDEETGEEVKTMRLLAKGIDSYKFDSPSIYDYIMKRFKVGLGL